MQNLIGQWLQSLKHYLLMCLMLSSPERLPPNVYCLALTVFAYFLIGLMLVGQQSYASFFAQILLELGMLALIVRLGLRWKRRPERFLQTFSALVGTTMIISAVSIPLQSSVNGSEAQPSGLAVYVFLAMLIWNLAVLSLIFKRAFEISTQMSAMISFNYFLVFYFTVTWLFL